MSWKNRFHGGTRDGAGRPKIGVAKQVKITMPAREWELIAARLEMTGESLSEYFRECHRMAQGGKYV